MTVTTPEPSVVTSLSRVRQQRLDVQLRQLEFHALLHRKLDIDLLFECVLTEGQSFLRFDGVLYHADGRGRDVHLGLSRQYCQSFQLKLGERSLGEVILMRGRPFSGREERDAERLVESLIYPLDNALEHYATIMLTMTDPATGLGNRRALDMQLPRELNLARRCGRPVSMLCITVDHLESLSEHHGNEIGVQAWHAVAQTLSARLRRSDLIYRIREDTFVIVLGDTAMAGAMALAVRLRTKVDRCVTRDNVQFVLTMSAGVTEASEPDSTEPLIERAERALAESRLRGRNHVYGIPVNDPTEDDPTAA